jgi:hypothetical protein
MPREKPMLYFLGFRFRYNIGIVGKIGSSRSSGLRL